ncbi:MAG TPA: transcriptional regulator [Bacteroidales bacterium]|nr:transcriptional regulator [Bacteroidales bacterium]
MEQIQMVDLRSQYLKIKDEIDAAIHEVIDTTAFIKGPAVADFEKALQKYTGVKHAIGCANGTDALQIALMALGVKPGDEVIVPTFTFIATAEVIALLQLKPVFVDVYADTFTMIPEQIEEAITQNSKVIIPVHLYGQCADMQAILEIADRHNLFIVEDAAQAIGSEYVFSDGTVRQAGCIGHIGCTSFFPSKNLGAFGDGGALFTNSDLYAEKIRSIINHGSKVKYFHEEIGVNSRLDTLQAAILNVKLKYLDSYAKARQEAAEYYNNAFAGLDYLQTPANEPFSSHVFHQYTIKIDAGKREAFKNFLSLKGIPCMVYYPVPMHLQEAYKFYGYKKGDLPISEELSHSVISLPMHTELSTEQLEYICNCVKEFFHNR